MQTTGSAGASATLLRIAAAATQVQDEETRQREVAADPEAYDEIFRRTATGVRETQKRLARERKHGQAQRTVLERHPQTRRLMMIRNDRRLHTWGLYQVLLEQSRRLAAWDAPAAGQMAELALAVARCLDPGEYGEERIADFHAGALAALAEAKRRLSDRAGAWEVFEAASLDLEEGTGDPLERAELEALRARLLRDFGSSEEAERSLRRALRLFRAIGDKRLEKGFADDPTHEVAHRRARG